MSVHATKKTVRNLVSLQFNLQCRNLTTLNAADTIFEELSSFSGAVFQLGLGKRCGACSGRIEVVYWKLKEVRVGVRGQDELQH
ncbi:MAG: hypothetical protein QG656_2198 [Candidatus Hydrogenedentes bacterium]|nr:hypothetical protein [Candidatus Hydrogenedentota bacterium]